MEFSYNIEHKDKYLLIKLTGNLLSAYLADEMMRDVNSFVVDDKVNTFIIDLSELQYMNSSGLGILIRLLTKARQAGGEAAVINVNERLKKLFYITKLDTLFVIEANEEMAKAKIVN